MKLIKNLDEWLESNCNTPGKDKNIAEFARQCARTPQALTKIMRKKGAWRVMTEEGGKSYLVKIACEVKI